MRRIFRRGPTTAAVVAIALAACGTVAGGTAYVLHERPGGASAGSPATPPAGIQANRPVTSVVPDVRQPAPLKRVVPPDYLIVGSAAVARSQLDRTSRLGHVRDVITADAGAVHLQGGKVNMFAVDPSQFRSWTPPGTAKKDELWSALAKDQFVVSGDVQRRFGLRTGMRYPVLGRTQTLLTMGGSGSLGLPGINVLVSRDVGRQLGLVPDIAVLVNAPGANLTKLRKGLRRTYGSGSQVIDLHATKNQPAGQPGGGKPNSYLDLYRQSAHVCPGLSWTVLAAIGQVESGHGRNTGPSSAGALGPMQFLPSTWARYGVDGDGDGKADIMNPYDAIPAAAKYLCAAGAPGDVQGAVFAYNHSQQYVNNVLSLARAYAARYS